MRRMCLTIVYLIVVGLPISAAEPVWVAAGSPWKAATPVPETKAASIRELADSIRKGYLSLFVPRDVQRPAWPTLTPNRLTVYPVVQPASPVVSK